MTDSSNKISPRNSWIVTGAVALAIFAGSAQAASPVPQATVRYAKRADTTHLYARLQAASQSVCRQHEGKELRHVTETRACYDRALNDAVAKVGDSALSALHHAKQDVRMAQNDSMARQRS
jgi:UrcA family protein